MKIKYDTFQYLPGLFLVVIFLTVILFNFAPSEESDGTESKDLPEIASPVPDMTEERENSALSMSEVVRPLEELGPVSSILISQHGEIIAEEYFGNMNADRGNNIKSASKSILSILVGIAIDKGYLDGPDQQIGEFFPDYFAENPDSVKASITIEDLLTMRSGLASTSGSNYGPWVTSSNWIRYALDRPLRHEPGTRRIYSTGNTHLLSVVLTRATGMSTLQFANRYLFGPMDIKVKGWDRDPQGYYLGGNNMALRPADMIKIGKLMMDAGMYNGERLVSKEWIVRSVEPVTGRRPGNKNYGYLWFRRMAGDYDMAYAFGNGGQYIMMLPELDAVIAVTTRNNSGQSTRSYRRQLFTSLDQQVIPLLEGAYMAGL